MNRRELFHLAAGAALAPFPSFADTTPAPPHAARRPVRIKQLGRVRIDEYAWLRDPDWKRVSLDPSLLQPEIRQHLLAENRYAEAILAPTRSRQDEYVERMTALAAADDAPPAAPDGPWEYYQYFRTGEDHPVHARRPHGGGKEQVLLDEQARAKGYAYYRISGTAHSPDHSLFLWLEATEGGDRYRICIRDLATGRIHEAPEADAFAIESVVFSACSQWLFWIRRDQHGRPTSVLRRPARGDANVVVYEEKDPALFIALGRTASYRFVTIRIHGPDLDEIRLVAADEPTGVPRLVEPRQAGVHYQVEDWNGELMILTDADGALDGKLMRASLAAIDRKHWRPWIAHREGSQILQVRAFEKHFARLQRRDGRLEVIINSSAAASPAEIELAFEEQAYTVGFNPAQEYASGILRLIYESPRTPPQWIDCELGSGRRKLVKAQTPGGGYSANDYQVRRLFARACDGESVPITVLMHKRTRLDGSAPLLLYAYGAYGISTEAAFSVANLALVEQGWIYAIAHVRGGSEKGRRWFLDGRRFSKANTFTDFIACAEHLIAQRYTRRQRIVAYGLSAGGLLMGAVANLRPDLWAGVIAQVPFVDMLNTMSDAQHPLVPLFRPDWGDPLRDPKAYDYIASISPYENVKPQRYPAILATAGLRDDRVSYWEPAKWIANLRRQTTGSAPILFLTDMTAGHQSAAGRSSQYRQIALFWAFAEQSLTFVSK